VPRERASNQESNAARTMIRFLQGARGEVVGRHTDYFSGGSHARHTSLSLSATPPAHDPINEVM
jgi:hypothetical protein